MTGQLGLQMGFLGSMLQNCRFKDGEVPEEVIAAFDSVFPGHSGIHPGSFNIMSGEFSSFQVIFHDTSASLQDWPTNNDEEYPRWYASGHDGVRVRAATPLEALTKLRAAMAAKMWADVETAKEDAALAAQKVIDWTAYARAWQPVDASADSS